MKCLFAIFTGIALLMPCGCASSSIDVTNDPSYWGGYRPGDIYATTQQVFLVKSNGYEVCRPMYESSHLFPETIKEYQDDPDRWPLVMAVLKVGTRFRIEKVTLNPYGLGLPSIWSSILGGPHDGRTVKITGLFPYTGFGVGREPDAKYLMRSNGER